MSNFFDATGHRDWWQDYGDYLGDDEDPLPDAGRRLAAAIRKANKDVYTVANKNAVHYGMGSTIVAVHLPPGTETMFVGHVGDSRCYRIRDASLDLLTRDHSLVNEALALDPEMTEEEVARLPSNIITRALGMEPTVDVDVGSAEVEQGDTILLCSDGLSGLLSNDEILEALQLLEDPREVCDTLVALANEAGGFDNITALVLRI
jgi:protein phosphatase